MIPPREGTIHTRVHVHISKSIYTLIKNHTSTSIYLQFHLSTLVAGVFSLSLFVPLWHQETSLIILSTCNNLNNTWCHESPISLPSFSFHEALLTSLCRCVSPILLCLTLKAWRLQEGKGWGTGKSRSLLKYFFFLSSFPPCLSL